MENKLPNAGSYWAQTVDQLYDLLRSSPQGISSLEAQKRIFQSGPSAILARKKTGPVELHGRWHQRCTFFAQRRCGHFCG